MQSKFIDWRADALAGEDSLSLTYHLNSSHYPQLEVLTRSRMKMLRKLFAQMNAPATPAKRYFSAPHSRLADDPEAETEGGLNDHPALRRLLVRLRRLQPQTAPFADFGPLEELGGAALDSPELYILSRSSATKRLELFYFHPHGDCLQELGAPDEERCSALFDPAVNAGPLQGAIFVAANLHRSLQLFGERGYRLSLLEGGRITERLAACSAGSGLRLQPVLGFYDSRVHQLLGLDGQYEVALSCLLLQAEPEASR
ncbi:hypothetical protein [Paenibacillus sp. B01]|uniref:hypothetical protein n=1 Tax=Paenibacillus sp. B01 TaxID=2660554 RepID=UPI00129B1669|nr:hypothetical protein [Paenibacillus sp. B01]QGG54430.1 hypothetical protein GE073_01640 [Paenibacillus sp. B01]